MENDPNVFREFMRNESRKDPDYICTECGKKAEGNHSWSDGSGEICDKCASQMEEPRTPGAKNDWY